MSLTARQILIALHNKFEGNWISIMNAIKNGNGLENPDLAGESELITLVDNEYPQDLKNTYRPPFVITKEELGLKEYEVTVVFKIQAHNLRQAEQLAEMCDIDFDSATFGKVRLAE